MCGRYILISPPDAIRRAFAYAEQPNFPPRYNIAPTQPVPVILLDQGARRLQLMRWGLLPAWVKDPRTFSLVINARAETVLDKPAFRNAMKRRRCLLPADGYYEWQPSPARKRPHFIRPRDGRPVAFAGLAETWVGPNGEELDTVAIITAPAPPDLATLHHRVPVTIAPDDFDRWLDGSICDDKEAATLLVAPPEGMFVWHEVSTAVNRVANDDDRLIVPITPEEAALEAAAAEAARKPRARVVVADPSSQPAKRKTAGQATKDDGQGSLF
ncbi:SOS response-associated peptidase [Afipia sp. TerB]